MLFRSAPTDSTTGRVTVSVKNAAGTSSTTVSLQTSSPAFFTFDGTYIAAVHLDGTFVGPVGFLKGVTSRPASPGERILLFGTGGGATSPAVAPETIFSGAAPLSSSNPLTMLFGTTTATVEFAGLISNGLNQFNIVVPRIAAGDYLVTPKIGSIVGDPAKLTVGN